MKTVGAQRTLTQEKIINTKHKHEVTRLDRDRKQYEEQVFRSFLDYADLYHVF